MKPIKLKINTKTQRYSLIIGSNLVSNIKEIFKRNSIHFEKCLLLLDNNIPQKMINKIKKSLRGKKIYIHSINASEKNKSQKTINDITSNLLEKNFSRQDCLIAIGGGITGDVGGFAASIYKRGLKFVNIPTTLLAQVDSSIGGKTGINSIHGKNLIGSFYQPALVVSDTDFLKSLPKREVVCGYGEILKHSLILNKNFYNFLNKNGTKILNLKSPLIIKAIYESCKIKKEVVEKDEREKSFRKTLNFGHTFAHAYEACLNYSRKLNHGEAVLLGIKSASTLSNKMNLLNDKEFKSIIDHLTRLNLPHDLKKYFSIKNINKILKFMSKDKKNNSEKINLILIKKIGSVLIDRHFKKSFIKNNLKKELIN